ncbi:unnamed protein product [Rotaria sp. Silwood2]|nr:unnamed protein product [Rotaria sp. Silwood2]
MEVAHTDILLGAIYVPPQTLPPIELFKVFKGKEFFLFGAANTSGVAISNWIKESGFEGIFPSTAISKRSDAVIDFAVGHSAEDWTTEVVDIGTSDHCQILYSSPFLTEKHVDFRKTNWTIFTFFLKCVFQYWNAFVYNIDEPAFFILFSKFLKVLWDRVSTYETVLKYRPPWPPYLVSLAKQVNSMRQEHAKIAMTALEEYSKDILLPVNVDKTKIMLYI